MIFRDEVEKLRIYAKVYYIVKKFSQLIINVTLLHLSERNGYEKDT